MSKEIIEEYVRKSVERLSGNNNPFRKKLDKESQTITFDAKIIKAAFRDQVNAFTQKGSKYININLGSEEDFQTKLESILQEIDINKILNLVRQKAQALYSNITRSGNTLQIYDLRISQSDLYLKIILETIYLSGDYKTISFDILRDLYSDTLKQEWQNLTSQIITLAKDPKSIFSINDVESFQSAQGKFALEHATEKSVSETRIGRELNTLLGNLVDHLNGSYDVPVWDENDVLNALNLQIFAKYLSNAKKNSTSLYVGSANKNSRQAAGELRIITNFKDAVENLLVNKQGIENLVNMGGSDNRPTIIKKEILKTVKEKIKKDKRTKVDTKDTKPKFSSFTTKKRSLKVTPKQKKRKAAAKSKKIKKKPVNFNAKSKKSTLNLNALKAQINAKLSMTVIKNMGTPALENRTGRFARSVEVTDVIQTPKGFPSIGYTYQKGPYQTFEPGFAQGSTQRDPRVVISKSIREIAKELIVGRFYTRRT